ncbi:MAG: 2-amino-4-hydroxy-6-hydroxymethyldihydropteridine diphosphokinase [Pseudomonadota bacterium]|nr:2-amino-4-hydroxy-6-hydroxymethyldihydropteridine diphosphokinase [Pseudomonadota bacterium]
MTDIQAYVALGANLGDPATQIERALDELARLPDTRLVTRSGLYLSKAQGYEAQPDFVNAVALLATRLAPRALLEALLDIEARHGRSRDFKNAPRTLDLDLLLYDGLVLHEPGLTLPHPRMSERAFVLQPMSEIAPDQLIPGKGNIANCLANLSGTALQLLPRSHLTVHGPTPLPAHASLARP